MTQAQSRSTLPLRLVSMQLPEAIDWIGHRLSDEDVLLLMPEKASEIALQLENTGSHSLQWEIQVTGNFPVTWYVNQQPRGEILPHQQLQGQLQFHIPIDFFEQQTALTPEKKRLELDYRAEICLFAALGDAPKQLVDYRSFQLWVRPHCNYLDFLPEIYQASDFMGRFLMIFEQAFDPTVQAMDVFWAHLDPLTAPRALLPFLSEWVAWTLDPRWTLKQQRRLLRNAVMLHRWRGTRWGLLMYLHLYTDLPLQEQHIPTNLPLPIEDLHPVEIPEAHKRISILENYSAGFVLGQAQFGQSPMLGGGKPYHFTVTLRPNRSEQVNRALVENIIEQVKPAFCTYDLWITSFSEQGESEQDSLPS